MSKSIKPEELQKKIRDYLNYYVEDIEDGVKETTEKISKEAVKKLKKESPRRKNIRKNPYWKGWTKRKETKNKRRYINKIYNKTNPSLTHILENGHSTKNGGHTKAQPHIKPIEEKYNKLYEKEIKETIIRRSKT
jgi:hypothetical protein